MWIHAVSVGELLTARPLIEALRDRLLAKGCAGIDARQVNSAVGGGAALNRHYVEQELRAAYTSGPVYYGADAFSADSTKLWLSLGWHY